MRILIATDGSECSYNAVRQLIRFTHATHHEVRVLYVIPFLTLGRATEYLQLEQEREGLSALNTVKFIFSEVGIHVEVELKQGKPADTIIQIARDGRYDLVVMGQRGRGGFREYLLGSVSKKVVSESPCSIFLAK